MNKWNSLAAFLGGCTKREWNWKGSNGRGDSVVSFEDEIKSIRYRMMEFSGWGGNWTAKVVGEEGRQGRRVKLLESKDSSTITSSMNHSAIKVTPVLLKWGDKTKTKAWEVLNWNRRGERESQGDWRLFRYQACIRSDHYFSQERMFVCNFDELVRGWWGSDPIADWER